MTRSLATADTGIQSTGVVLRQFRNGIFRSKLLLIVIATIAVMTAGCGSDSEAISVPQATDGGSEHIDVGELHAPYGTVPATSGPHWSSFPAEGAPLGAPVVWGVYGEVIADEALLHNLEHGGIGLHYDCPVACPELATKLEAFADGDPSQFVVSPYPDMPSRIAITAWRRVLHLDEFDAGTISAFIKTYQDRAPESVASNPSALGSDCGPAHAADSDSDSASPTGGSCSE